MRPLLVLAVSVTAISAAAVLVRLAPGVHPIAAGFWRTAIVAGLLLPFAFRDRKVGIGRKDLGLTLLAGALLALHFWSWFASLHMTTVLRSTVLVCLSPVWTGLIEWIALGRRPGARHWAGIGVALVGVAAMTGGMAEGGALLGDGLAILAGLLGAIYLVVGRSVRQRVGIGVYGALVCAACALWLLPAAMATGAPLWGFSLAEWAVLLALALGPQLLGHIGFNYSIRYLPAAVFSAAFLLEPVGAAGRGALLLAEVPGPREIGGAALAILGVGLAIFGGRRAPEAT